MAFIHSQFSDYFCEVISFYTTFKSRPFEFQFSSSLDKTIIKSKYYQKTLLKSSRRETILLYCHTMTNWTEQTVDVLKHHLLQTLHGCFLLRIKKDLSLFTLTADCSYDVTWSHGMCYLHFGNEVRNSRCNAADYCKEVCTYRDAWSIICHEFGY